uniref:Disks large homolog 5 N-terminal domain-containing protein n=1 Tax=Rattus norvegicus TaxID=10116 RepID=A0ABK0M5I8_RAT
MLASDLWQFSCFSLLLRSLPGSSASDRRPVSSAPLVTLAQRGEPHKQHEVPFIDAGRETSSPGTELSENQAKKEKEKLIKELQLITEERNDLRDRLRFLTERSMKNRPHFRPNPYYEDLERMEEAVMSILHNLEMENTEVHENNHKLKKEITFSRNLLSQLLMDNTCRKKLFPLKQESKEVHLDCALNQKYLVDFNKKDKDQQRPDPASSGLRKCKRAGIGHTAVRELPEE